MARERSGSAPPGPTATTDATAEPDRNHLQFPPGAGAEAEAEPVPPAEPKKKKAGPRGGELSIMQQIARRMNRLPSDAARARVAGWFAEEFVAKGGESS